MVDEPNQGCDIRKHFIVERAAPLLLPLPLLPGRPLGTM
jgi:hypothetical protein